MMRIVLAVAGSIVLTSPAAAQDSQKVAVGLGILPCAAVLPLDEKLDFRDRLAQWVTGFATGLNAPLASGKIRNLEDFTPADAVSRIFAACRVVDPDTTVMAVTLQLFNRMPAYVRR